LLRIIVTFYRLFIFHSKLFSHSIVH
jgi:hypothetical protein